MQSWSTLYSKRRSSRLAATVTLVHAYNDILGVVNRTAGEHVLLLRVECFAEQAPVLNTDFCPQM